MFTVKIYSEIDIRDFEFWEGAEYTADAFTEEELATIQDRLVELYPDGMSDVELNDLFWHDEDFVAELAGYSSFENVKIGKTKDDEEWDEFYDAELDDLEEEDRQTQKMMEMIRNAKVL